MHFIYVTAALPYSRGETFITPEVLELQRLGHRVTVVPIRPGQSIFHADAQILANISVRESLFAPRVFLAALSEALRAPQLTLHVLLLLTTSRSVNVLLKNLAVFPKGLWLAQLARQRGADHIHAHFVSTNGTAALIASMYSGISWSFTAHRWDISENNLLDAKVQHARFVRAIDTRGALELATLAGIPCTDVRVIHMGVTVPAASKVDEESSGSLRVLLAARFDEFKGHRFAVEAIGLLKKDEKYVSLCCAGDGPLQEEIQRMVAEFDVRDRVQFLGLLSHDELLARLRDNHWDVAILPSTESTASREGIPVSLIEAMAAGVPVVATNTGGIPELLRGGAGLLVEQQDPRAIANALTQLATDRQLRHDLSRAGTRRVQEEFTIEHTVAALVHEIGLP